MNTQNGNSDNGLQDRARYILNMRNSEFDLIFKGEYVQCIVNAFLLKYCTTVHRNQSQIILKNAFAILLTTNSDDKSWQEISALVDYFEASELPPPYGGGLHEFQPLLSGIFPALMLNVFSNNLFVDTNGGYKITV